MDTTTQDDQQLRDIQRQYLDFLDDDVGFFNYFLFFIIKFFNYFKPADDVNRTNQTPNQLNTIECNQMIEIRLPNAIESQANITVIFSIDSITFDWLMFSIDSTN